MKYAMKKFGDGNYRRIEDEAGVVAALIVKMANGAWCLNDTSGNRLPGFAAMTDRAVFNKWVARQSERTT